MQPTPCLPAHANVKLQMQRHPLSSRPSYHPNPLYGQPFPSLSHLVRHIVQPQRAGVWNGVVADLEQALARERAAVEHGIAPVDVVLLLGAAVLKR